MVSNIWKINQQIFHHLYYNNDDDCVDVQYENDYYSTIINCLRYFQFDFLELSYPSKQFCVRYIYAHFLQEEYGEDCEKIFNDSALLYNNDRSWYDDDCGIFGLLTTHVGNPLLYQTDGVRKTIYYAQQEFGLVGVKDDLY